MYSCYNCRTIYTEETLLSYWLPDGFGPSSYSGNNKTLSLKTKLASISSKIFGYEIAKSRLHNNEIGPGKLWGLSQLKQNILANNWTETIVNTLSGLYIQRPSEVFQRPINSRSLSSVDQKPRKANFFWKYDLKRWRILGCCLCYKKGKTHRWLWLCT